MNKETEIFVFFKKALEYCKENFYGELKYVNDLDFNKTTQEDFFRQFIFVVLSAGMRNQAVESWFSRIWNNGNVNPEEAKALLEGFSFPFKN